MADGPNGVQKANANPSKSFFIAMLTRDIDLVDCILDLLDNSVDGISETAKRENRQLPEEKPFAGYEVDIAFDRNRFEIEDRSGGIPLQIARDYAFRFGRPDDAPPLNDGTIGLYGIGMKRAIFKMGNCVRMESSTGLESFELSLDVERWRHDPQVQEVDGDEVMEWSFDLDNVVTGGTPVAVGTRLTITELYEGIRRQFDNPAFLDYVRRVIARDYAFILSRGLSVKLNGTAIVGSMPSFRMSAEIEPLRRSETVGNVRIEITAGLADPPPDDVSATARNPEAEAYGWYVVCNDRVIVNADKSRDTGWGIRPVPAWHPQFSGFMGVVRFESDDPKLLPWKTTKRDVEASNEYYLRALPLMMNATKKIVDYTNQRRSEAKRLRKVEKAAVSQPVARIVANTPMKLPAIHKKDVVSIEYVRETEEVEAVAEALGMIGSSASDVGIKTFEYFYNREVRR